MSTWQRVAGFVVVAGVAVALALGVGRVAGPVDADDEGREHGSHGEPSPADAADHGADHAGDFSLRLARTTYDAGRQQLAFTVRDGDGEPVTSYDVAHEKLLHLVVVRRDLGGFRHVHPTLDAESGTWSVPLDLDAGTWRVYADFTPRGGEQTVAEADLSVAGDFVPRELPAASDVARVDGYEVHLAREAGMLRFHVTRGGRPVTDLQPYLGAYGHLVAIRAADLTYLHVHPEQGEPGPEIAFHAALDAGDRYRIFLEFRHGGEVHRAELTVAGDAREESHGEHHH